MSLLVQLEFSVRKDSEPEFLRVARPIKPGSEPPTRAEQFYQQQQQQQQ